MPTLFLSYIPEDRAFADALVTQLRLDGATVVDLAMTQAQQLDAALAFTATDRIILLLSPTSLGQPEITRYLNTDTAQLVIPVILRSVPLTGALSSLTLIFAQYRTPEEVAHSIQLALDAPRQQEQRDEMAEAGSADASGSMSDAELPSDGVFGTYLEEAAPEPLPPPPPRAVSPPPTPAPQAAPSEYWATGDNRRVISPPPAPASQGAPAPQDLSRKPGSADDKAKVGQTRGGNAPEPRRRKSTSTDGANDTLQFSAYHPNSLAVDEWYTLLCYTHIAAALAQVQADVTTFTELGSAPSVATSTASRVVAQGVELTIEPHMDGVTFSPTSASFIWRGEWQRSLFRFNGNAQLAGRSQQGWLDVYADQNIPIARIDLSFPFRAPGLRPHIALPQGLVVTGNIHDNVFISYSHADRVPFEQACEMYKQFGITVMTDQQLEAGDDYEQTLAAMIDGANVFHLLWSPHSARSTECRKEWTRALQREPSERFIKPWFWKQPLITPPPEISAHHISFRYQHLKRKLLNPATW